MDLSDVAVGRRAQVDAGYHGAERRGKGLDFDGGQVPYAVVTGIACAQTI